MTPATNLVFGSPLYSDGGVLETPAVSGGSWTAGQPASNVKRRELWKIARSTSAALKDTRLHIDLGRDRPVGLIAAIHARTISEAGKVRFLGKPASMLFDYESGDDIAVLGGTFTRASVATYVDSAGVLRTAASGVIRDSHFIGGIRHTLLEDARTNLCLQSENFGTTWVPQGTPTRVAAAHTASGVTLDLIGDDTTGAREGYSQAITFTGNGTKAFSVDIKQGTSTSTEFELFDATAGITRLFPDVSWSAGLPVVNLNGIGAYLGYEARYDGVFRLWFQVPSVVAANTNTIFVWPAAVNGASPQTGTVYVGGVQVENALFPSSYIKTTTVAVTRAADALRFPFAAAPQAMTMYARIVEKGSIRIIGSAGGVAYIGDAAATGDPHFYAASNGSGIYRAADYSVISVEAVAPTLGDLTELRALLYADGSVQLGQAINGATEVVAAQSGVHTLGGAWGGNFLYINSLGTGSVGFNAFQSVRVMAGLQTLATMRSIVYDSGWLTAWPADVIASGHGAELVAGMNLPVVAIAPATQPPVRYVSMQIDDSSNPAGYIDVARVGFCGAYQAPINFKRGAKLGLTSSTVRREMESGGATYLERPTARVWDFAIGRLASGETMDRLLTMQRILGKSGQLFFVGNPADVTHVQHVAGLYVFREISGIEWANDLLDDVDVAFSLIEELA